MHVSLAPTMLSQRAGVFHQGTPWFRLSRGSGPRAQAANRTCIQSDSTEKDVERMLRQQLAKPVPNALLLEGSRLPDVYNSKHFVNLTNGLELAPLLQQQLQLPFSVVRIRSTSLEQQAFESLLLELDANLLLHLALGHSCVVWDAGCRNRKTGAPRALWYGLEFIRFALNRCWCTTDSSSSSSRRRPHIRGHDVSRDFEAACRSLHPSTKTRLRYYKRYVSAEVAQNGVELAGAFRRTDRDEDVQHFVGLARQCCGPSSSAIETVAVTNTAQTAPLVLSGDQLVATAVGHPSLSLGADACALNVQAYRLLIAEGIGMFSCGLSHTEYRSLNLNEDSEP